MRQIFAALLCGFVFATQAQNPEQVFDQALQQPQFVCPMHSHIVREHEGNCPICGMALVPRERPVVGGSRGINIHPAMQQNMALKTAPVQRGDLWRFIPALGTVAYDETRILHLHSRVRGWIENLQVNIEGQQVTEGDLLYELYSPELVVAQDDFLQTLDVAEQRSSDTRGLVAQGRLRLQLLGLSESVIQRVEKTRQALYRVPFYASQTGVVTNLNVRDGMYVEPELELMSITDLSQLWVFAEVFESQFDWLKPAMQAEIAIQGIGIQGQSATLDYIYPELDPVSRAIRVRLLLENPLGRIKPGMLAQVSLFGGPKADVLHIPVQALIQSSQQNRVVVQTTDDYFAVRNVRLGMRTRERVEILEGVQAGDTVVVSGQFLIDSEANLQGQFERLTPPSAHSHGSH